MTRYASAEAFRHALETRLARRSFEAGVDLGRLRRRVAMERILVRLDRAAPRTWVLKGGTALEVRMPGRARATLDVDLSTRHAFADGDLEIEVREALGRHADGDRFSFELSPARFDPGRELTKPVWRCTVTSRVAGRVFVELRLDIAERPGEIGLTERLAIPNSLEFDDVPGHDFEVIAASQHFAEKLHALTRDYGRENTRSRDLIDLVLLIDNGLVTPTSVLPAVHLVFGERGSHPVPVDLDDPPGAWAEPFARMAAEVGSEARTVPAAMAVVRAFWADALRIDQRG